jgi:hypothetical protein
MELIKIITTTILAYLNENQIKTIDFESFPENIRKTLKDEYGHYFLNNFDWNTKQDEFSDKPQEFRLWLKNNEAEEFIKNIDKLIQKTRQDLILLQRKKATDKALDYFEELIIPVLDNKVLVEPLSVFMTHALIYNHTVEDINNAFKDAKNIIDSDGSLNFSKITPSTIFVGDSISLPNFERFAKKNLEYMGVFNDWKKLFDRQLNLSVQELNAYRDSTQYKEIRDLYMFLIEYKKKLLV